jgi:WD40 repeat protein
VIVWHVIFDERSPRSALALTQACVLGATEGGGGPLLPRNAHRDWVSCVAFAPAEGTALSPVDGGGGSNGDGGPPRACLLATSSWDKSARVWRCTLNEPTPAALERRTRITTAFAAASDDDDDDASLVTLRERRSSLPEENVSLSSGPSGTKWTSVGATSHHERTRSGW